MIVPTNAQVKQEGGGKLIDKSITKNGTYNASDDNADGYSSVDVDVPDSLVAFCESKTDYASAFASSTIKEIPEFITNPNATRCDKMCAYATNLVKFNTNFDFSKMSNTVYAFLNCSHLEEIPELIDLKSCTNANSMFYYTSVHEVHITNSDKVWDFGQFLRFSEKNLTTVETIDGTSCTNFNYFFYYNNYTKLTHLRIVPNTIHVSFNFRCCPALDSDSVQSIVDGLATVTSAQTVTFNNAITLSAQQQQDIADKGWTLAFA